MAQRQISADDAGLPDRKLCCAPLAKTRISGTN